MEETLAVRRLDRLGVVLVAGGIAATALLPFIYVKANRIAAGKPMLLTQLLPQPSVLVLLVLLAVTALATLFLRSACMSTSSQIASAPFRALIERMPCVPHWKRRMPASAS